MSHRTFTSIVVNDDLLLVDLEPENDRRYHETVAANYREQEAGRHVMRMLDALLSVSGGDFIPRAAIEQLVQEHAWIAAGNPPDWLDSYVTGEPGGA